MVKKCLYVINQERTGSITLREATDPVRWDGLFFYLFVVLAGTEQEGNTPDSGQSDHGVDNTAEQRGLPAANPGYQVKLEQTDAAPV